MPSSLKFQKSLAAKFILGPVPQLLSQFGVLSEQARCSNLCIRDDVSPRVFRSELRARHCKQRRPSTLFLIIQDAQAAHDWSDGTQDRARRGTSRLFVEVPDQVSIVRGIRIDEGFSLRVDMTRMNRCSADGALASTVSFVGWAIDCMQLLGMENVGKLALAIPGHG